MTHRVLCALVATAALAVARPAAAQAHDVGDWSILGAETVKPGSDVIYGAFGWPDASFGFTHGMNPNFDLGFRFSLVYGVENTTTSQFGIAAAMPLRWAFGRPGNVHLLFHFDPGLRLYTYDPTPFGFQFPVGLNLEFLTRAPFKFGLGADFNMSLFVTGGREPEFVFGPLFGPFLEYHVDRQLAIGFDTRFGAIIDAASSPSETVTRFGFRAQLLLAYRL